MKRYKAMLTLNVFLIVTVLFFVTPSEADNACLSCDHSQFKRFVNCVAYGMANNREFKDSASSLDEMKSDMLEASKAMKMKGSKRENAVKGMIAFELADLVEKDENSDKKIAFIVNTLQRCYRIVYRSSDNVFFDECEKTIKIIVEERKNTPDEQQPGDQLQSEGVENANTDDFAYADASAAAYNGPQYNRGKYPKNLPDSSDDYAYADASAVAYNGPQGKHGKYPKNSPGSSDDYAFADASAVAYNEPQDKNRKYPKNSPGWSNDYAYADASATAYNGPEDNSGKNPENSPSWGSDYTYADASATAYNGPQDNSGKYPENSPGWNNDNSYADASASAYSRPQRKKGKYPKNSPGWNNGYAYADASATGYNGPQDNSGKYPKIAPGWSNDNSYADASAIAYNGPQGKKGKYPENAPAWSTDYAYADSSASTYNGPQNKKRKYPENQPGSSNDNAYADASSASYNEPKNKNGKYPQNSYGWSNNGAYAGASAVAYNEPQANNGKYPEKAPNFSNDYAYADSAANTYNGPQSNNGKYLENSPGLSNDYAYSEASADTYSGPKKKNGKYLENSPGLSNDYAYSEASADTYNGPKKKNGKYLENSPGLSNDYAYSEASADTYNGPKKKNGKYLGKRPGWKSNGVYAGALAYAGQQNNDNYNQQNSDSSQTQKELQTKKTVNALKFSETLYDKFYKSEPFWKVYHEYTLNYQAVSITYYALYKAMISCGYSEDLAREMANNSIAFMKKFPEKSKTPSYAEAICKMTMVQFNSKDMIDDDPVSQGNKLGDAIIAVLCEIENPPTPEDNNSQPDVSLTTQQASTKDYEINDGSDYEDYSVSESSSEQQPLLVENSQQNFENGNKGNDEIDYSVSDNDNAPSSPQKWHSKKRVKKPKIYDENGQFYDGQVQLDDKPTKSKPYKKGDRTLGYNENENGYSDTQTEQIKKKPYAYNSNDQFSDGNSKIVKYYDDNDQSSEEYPEEYEGIEGTDDYPDEDFDNNSADLVGYSEEDDDLPNDNPDYPNDKYSDDDDDIDPKKYLIPQSKKQGDLPNNPDNHGDNPDYSDYSNVKYGDYDDIKPKKYRILHLKKHHQPSVYKDDEPQKSKPLDIDQKSINTAPAEPEKIKEKDFATDKQTDLTIYSEPNVSDDSDYDDIKPKKYRIPHSKKHHQPSVYKDDELQKSNPLDIDQKSMNTAPAEPEKIKEKDFTAEKQTSLTIYSEPNISDDVQNPKIENNAESKDRVKILMKWALDCIKDGKFDYPTYSGVIAALARFVQQTHPEWPPQKAQTTVLIECVFAVTQLLTKSEIKETEIIIQQPEKDPEPAPLPVQSNEPPIESEPEYQPAVEYPAPEKSSSPNQQIQQKESEKNYPEYEYDDVVEEQPLILESEPVFTNSAPQQNVPENKNWNVNNQQGQNNPNPFSVILNTQQFSQQPSAPEQISANQGNSNAEAYSYSQTTDSNARVPNINNYQYSRGNQFNSLGFQKGLNNPNIVSNENQASWSYSENSENIPSFEQSTNLDFIGYQDKLSALTPNSPNNINLAQKGYQSNGGSIAQNGFNSPNAAQDGNLGNWASNGLNSFNLGQNTYQDNSASIAQNGNRGNLAPIATNGLNNLNLGYQNGYQSNSVPIAQNGLSNLGYQNGYQSNSAPIAQNGLSNLGYQNGYQSNSAPITQNSLNNLNLAQDESQDNWGHMTQNVPNNQGNLAPSRQKDMNSQNFMQPGNQGFGGVSQQNSNPPNSFSPQRNQFNWG